MHRHNTDAFPACLCAGLVATLMALGVSGCSEPPDEAATAIDPNALAREDEGYALTREPLEPYANVVTDTGEPPYSRNNPQARADETTDVVDSPVEDTGLRWPQAGTGGPGGDASPDLPLDPAEAGFAPTVEQTFELLDADNDGVLSAEEFAAIREVGARPAQR